MKRNFSQNVVIDYTIMRHSPRFLFFSLVFWFRDCDNFCAITTVKSRINSTEWILFIIANYKAITHISLSFSVSKWCVSFVCIAFAIAFASDCQTSHLKIAMQRFFYFKIYMSQCIFIRANNIVIGDNLQWKHRNFLYTFNK